jgi:hypothetical protein
MNDFATELKELIDRHLDRPGVTAEDIIGDLMDAIERVDEEDDDE